jgi:hypothetical protein
VVPQGLPDPVSLTQVPPFVSLIPAAMLAQVPPAPVQALQFPHDATPQQRPSTQLPPGHWLPMVQESPRAKRPQLPLGPGFMQMFGLTQSVIASAQVVLQVLVKLLHWKVPHDSADTGTQAPMPSQLDRGVCELPTQLSVPHLVAVLSFWQAPLPSHFPFNPQGGAATHWLATVGKTPAPMLLHVPGDACNEQLLHVSVHAVLQQMPSTQWPELH